MALSKTGFLWFHIIPLIPSLIVTVFVLYHFLKSRALRTSLSNHPVILMLSFGLILELTDTVWFIHFYRTGQAISTTPAFCLAWVFIDSSLFVSVSLQMSWASIERHILIFHPNWLATKTKRVLLHYLPLFILSVWPLVFYFVMLLALPCDAPFDYRRRLCGRYDCVNLIQWVAMFDSIAHYMVPAFIIAIFSVALFVRVVYHKYHIRQRIEWRNYRKMALQLLSISLVYMVLEAPPMVLNAAYLSGLSSDVAADYYSDMLDLSLWVILFTPFASATALPGLKAKCRSVLVCWRRRRVVQPVTITMNRRKSGHTVGTTHIAH
jgi:hypothetical protein